MSESSKHRLETSTFPEKTSKLSVEITRLMREGTPEGRKKAQELLQAAREKRGALQAVKGDIA
jgi:hypothetical protein